MSNDASSQSGISDLIKGAVDKAYEVVDVYIKEGQEAAKHIRDGVYTNSNAETDVQNLINHWVKLVKELSVTGIEILSIIVRDTRLVPTPGRPASSPPGARGPAPQSPSAQIAVETRSKSGPSPSPIGYESSPLYSARSSPLFSRSHGIAARNEICGWRRWATRPRYRCPRPATARDLHGSDHRRAHQRRARVNFRSCLTADLGRCLRRPTSSQSGCGSMAPPRVRV